MSQRGKTLLRGHTLQIEGAVVFDGHTGARVTDYGRIVYEADTLHAKCGCGAFSPAGISRRAAQRWHLEHKDSLRPSVAKPTCKEPDCERPHKARGLCETHYARTRKPRDPRGALSRAIPRDPIPGEEWLALPGWEGMYEVSNLGRVYRVKEYYNRRSGRIMRQHTRSTGHLTVRLYRNRKAVSRLVHQLVLEAFVGPRPPGMQVRHLDGNPANNRLENLRYGTPSENTQDCLRHGTHVHASKTHCPYDHPYDLLNTYIQPSSGGRKCRTCKARRAREYEERRKARGVRRNAA